MICLICKDFAKTSKRNVKILASLGYNGKYSTQPDIVNNTDVFSICKV